MESIFISLLRKNTKETEQQEKKTAKACTPMPMEKCTLVYERMAKSMEKEYYNILQVVSHKNNITGAKYDG